MSDIYSSQSANDVIARCIKTLATKGFVDPKKVS